MIEFSCPHCSKELKTADDKAGQKSHCPGCGAEVMVPESDVTQQLLDAFHEGAGNTRDCPSCGEPVPTSATVCKYCGEKLGRGKGRSLLAPHRGVLILVLGILSWVVCPLLGIVAWVMGSNDLKEMDAGRMDDEGRAMTQTGRIIGIVFFGLFILACVMIGLIILVGVGAGMADMR